MCVCVCRSGCIGTCGCVVFTLYFSDEIIILNLEYECKLFVSNNLSLSLSLSCHCEALKTLITFDTCSLLLLEISTQEAVEY